MSESPDLRRRDRAMKYEKPVLVSLNPFGNETGHGANCSYGSRATGPICSTGVGVGGARLCLSGLGAGFCFTGSGI
jgi:hypothetical protein